MRLKILQAGEPVLRAESRALDPTELRSSEIQRLIADMRETMNDAPGVGLAAPQVGMPLQLAVIEDKEEYQKGLTPEERVTRERSPVPFHVIVNPKITPDTSEVAEFHEGCLSVAGFLGVVSRARRVLVECLDEHGEPRVIHASGWYARILQHEIDHLRGTLYIDRMQSRTFTSLENWNRFMKGR